MIIIRVWGGIGNQLFQYSFGEYLHQKTKEEVQYDICSFGYSDKLREYQLNILNSNILIYHPKVLNISKYTGITNRIMRFLFCLNPYNKYISERNFKLNEYSLAKKYTYFQGYWQNEFFVDQVIQTIPDFYEPKLPIPTEINAILDRIKSQAKIPVALHVRRGDYFLPKNVKMWGVCDVDYYQKAICMLKEQISDFDLFIFSDDLDWVKQNLELPTNVFFVPNLDVNQYWYIYLMSSCQHNIISNSSFSWWGAWLNKNPNKIIISPSKWKRFDNSKQITPDEWIRI